ncbi:MAG TPA: zeta toxin family protein [Mucilaginibacter sp.]|nr:zeta toxin family protein [Mucilaginibacter sp.]
MNETDLHRKYGLSAHVIQEIQDQIIQIFTTGVTPEEEPIAILLGGQPGSGKGELITYALKMANDNLVICNADDFRDFHPQANEIKSNHEGAYPEITAAFSQPWNDGLRAYCEANRLSYVMETTFSSRIRMSETITDIKDKGYKVIILLLAVNERFSLLGTHLRYQDMKAASGYGRMVSKKIHDEKLKLIPETLHLVAIENRYDTLMIFGRNHFGDLHAKSGIELIAKNPDDPLATYLKERDRHWSKQTWQYFNSCCYKVADMLGHQSRFKKSQFLKNFGIRE